MLEITARKIKATKSLVNQFRCANLEVLKNGNVLGFVQGVVKGESSTLLLEFDGNYYREQIMNWEKVDVGTPYVYCRNFSKYLGSKEAAIEWLAAYNLVKNHPNASVQLFV
jgi:hypothetical protein